MKVINIANGKVLANIVTNHSMTIEEALELVGIDLSQCDENEGFFRDLDGKPFWMENLKTSPSEGKREVKNSCGTVIDYDVAEALMDDEIREALHCELAPCTDQEFFDAYSKAHAENFGEEWELNKENPCY